MTNSINTEKTGILLANLGTPEAPTAEAVKPYLAEFLSDPNVVSIPKLLWWPILHGIILRTRPAKSAEAYQKIWMDKGSPLLVHSQKITDKVTARLQQTFEGLPVVLGMSYGQPSIAKALEVLADCQRIIVLPLYPQYSSASTASVEWVIQRDLKKQRFTPNITVINNYHDHPDYIQALANSVREHWAKHGQQDHLLFSFHGMPERTRQKGDPYYDQCQKTAELLSQALQLNPEAWKVAFQSRFGREKWLQPYISDVLTEWAAQGEQSVAVICPGFAADCLETLEEINMQYREEFLQKGGKAFHYIPALNDNTLHIEGLVSKIKAWL